MKHCRVILLCCLLGLGAAEAEQIFLLQTPDRTVGDDFDIEVFTVGARYSVLQDENDFDLITLKVQYAYVPFKAAVELDTFSVEADEEIHLFGLALSVLF